MDANGWEILFDQQLRQGDTPWHGFDEDDHLREKEKIKECLDVMGELNKEE